MAVSKRPLHTPTIKPTVSDWKASSGTKVGGWPLWFRLALLSIVVYLLLIIWFVHTLERELPAVRPGSVPLLHQPQQQKPIIKITSALKEQSREEKDSHVHTPSNGQKKSINDQPTGKDQSENTVGNDETLFYGFNRRDAEAYIKDHGPGDMRQTIGAFLEPETAFVVTGTVNQGAIDNDKDPGIPPQFIMPLPLRTFTPDDLKHYEYPKFQTCHDLPAKLPVDRGLELDSQGNPVVWNVGNKETPPNYVWDEAPYCPVDADPFLPWIHDVFPTTDGTVLEFIAHNRRRCKTGRKHRPDVLRLEPQVALMQHVSVERLTPERAAALAPELWNDESSNSARTPRYRLAPMNESSTDGRFTRFICRFHGTVLHEGKKPQSIVIEETLSIYPYNYEFVSYRKNKPTMITPKGKDNQYFWMSVLRFQCPVPSSLIEIVRSGRTILSDGTPTLHVDLIPIRTPPRFGVNDHYLTEDMIGPRSDWKAGELPRNGNADEQGFDPYTRWGNRNVLPRVEASGRWANLPICQPPRLPTDDDSNHDTIQKAVAFDGESEQDRGTKKPHLLSACVWASASFKTRGGTKAPVLDTGSRLIEWIEFHLMVGFDHIYVFDNSGAQTNQTSLKHILDLYPKSKISRIEWPSIICNNNIPAHDSTGERSSQYTAENACRTRFAPFTEWIAAFDTDEYMVPAGKNENLRDVVRAASTNTKTNILSFRSSRARLLYERSQ